MVAHNNTTLRTWHSSYWISSVHVFSLTLLPWKRNSLGHSYCSCLRLLSRNTSAVLSSSIFFLPYLMVCDCTQTLELAWHPWIMQLLTARVAWVLPSLASICARQGEMNHSTFLKEHSCLSPLISLTAWFTPSLEWRYLSGLTDPLVCGETKWSNFAPCSVQVLRCPWWECFSSP